MTFRPAIAQSPTSTRAGGSAKLSSDPHTSFQIIDEPLKYLIERTALFARKDRRGIDLWKHTLRFKCLRKRQAVLDLVLNINKDRAEIRRGGPRFQKRDRLKHRDTRPKQCRKLLIEQEKIHLLDGFRCHNSAFDVL